MLPKHALLRTWSVHIRVQKLAVTSVNNDQGLGLGNLISRDIQVLQLCFYTLKTKTKAF